MTKCDSFIKCISRNCQFFRAIFWIDANMIWSSRNTWLISSSISTCSFNLVCNCCLECVFDIGLNISSNGSWNLWTIGNNSNMSLQPLLIISLGLFKFIGMLSNPSLIVNTKLFQLSFVLGKIFLVFSLD